MKVSKSIFVPNNKYLMMKSVLLLLFAASVSFSQSFNNGFNFYLPSTDTVTQNFLPSFPVHAIGNNDFVNINSDGKFSVNGKRIRFWGTNSVAESAFPSESIAGEMAGRLRKFGFNLIRLHHLDNAWTTSLLDRNSTRHLNTQNLDLLENYIANLKANGIYINMNLHVSRTFVASDGVVDYDSIPEFGKCVNFFDPYILQLHKEYAQQLLTHVNPYTGKALVDDPVMAMVEITNENSLYRNWRDNKLKPIVDGGILPVYYNNMLDSLWIKFLKDKYSSTSNLKNAWDAGLVTSGTQEKLVNGGFESGTSNWKLGVWVSDAAGTFTIDNSTNYSGSSSAKIEITKSTGIGWNIQFQQLNLSIKKDSLYTISFAAKADRNITINAAAQRDGDPYDSFGSTSALLGNDWKLYSFSFRAGETNNGKVRVDFDLGSNAGTIWIDDVSFKNTNVKGLLDGESFESNNIARLSYSDCPEFSEMRVKDISEFYINTQRNYFKEMIGYLKNDLHVKVPIVTSNWTVGPADLASMSDGDYVDNHAYWDHPQFPTVPWSSTDWLINNTPMIKETNGGTIPYLFTSVPMKGKPLTVSEYNEAAPNQFQVESIMFTTCYSSFYDSDAFMYFDYEEPGNWNVDKITGFFGINRNSLYMAFFPTAAYAFRNGFIEPSRSPVYIDYSADTLYSLPRFDPGNWWGTSMINSKNGLINAVKVNSYFSNSTSNIDMLQNDPVNPYLTDTGEIEWNDNVGTLTLNADKINGATGFMNNLINKNIGDFKVLDFPANDFGAFTWISLTNEGLANSSKSLITIGSKIQNTNMIWDGTTTVHDNLGTEPTIIYPLDLKIELTVHADSIKIFPLDNYGKENIATSITVMPSSHDKFIFDFDQNKYKTLWFGIEKFGDGVTNIVDNENEIPYEFELKQNYPNPFNPSTTIKYSIPNVVNSNLAFTTNATLKIYDILGREIKTLVNENKSPGTYEVKFDAASYPSGIYFYTLSYQNRSITKKMIFLK